MNCKNLLLATLLFFSFTLMAQQTAKLVGTVTEETGDALPQANVVIDASKGQAAVTDFDGKYEINLPAGTYSVTFRYIGKDEQKRTVTLADGEKKILDIQLTEKQQMIDVVVVTGTKYEQRLAEQTVSMDVLKGSSLTSQNITDLSQGMTRVPGVTIADGQVNIRGGSGWSYGAGSRVQVMVDDLPLLTADAADAKWSVIPMENVEQVEVIKGSASALYGSGALNGIINVRTAYPVTEPYTKVSIYTGVVEGPSKTPGMKFWGSNSPLSGGINFAHRQKFGQHDLVLGGAYDAATGHLDSSDSHSMRGTVKYRYRVKKVQGLSVGVNMSGYYSYGKTFFFWNGLDSNAYKPFPNTVTIYKNYRITVDPFIDYYDAKNNHFKILGRFFNATNTNSTGQGSIPNRYYLEAQYSRKFDFKKFDFNVVAGAVNIYDDVNPPKGASGSLFGKNNSYNFSAYAQADFKFFKKLNVSVGARWEYITMSNYKQDSTIASVSGADTTYNYYQRLNDRQNSLKQLPYPLFRIGLNYQAAEATFIRASFGQGFRYPTIAEHYVSTTVGPLTIASNPLLEPEKGYSAELGVKQGFKIGKNFVGFVDAAFFWNQYDNMMEFTFGQFGDSKYWAVSAPGAFDNLFGLGFSSQNIGKTRILGTELTVGGQGKLGPVEIQFLTGYNFIDPRSLNWNDSMAIFNYQGYQILNGYEANSKNQLIREAYNNPGQLSYLTYAQTSSSTTNFLKYRSRHTFKFDLTMKWKGLEWNTNLQYSSYQENVDYAFVSPLLTSFYGTAPSPQAFSGLKQYRQEKESIAIGKGRGDIVLNMHLAYNFTQGVRVAFLVKNILNWEYTPRPAYMESPRNYTLQLSYTLPHFDRQKDKK
jgi:outer membrane receptor protein involved in Fe transport